MTEKEKMIGGELYDSRDTELLNRYSTVRKLLHSFNHEQLTEQDEKKKLLGKLFGSMGENVWIEAPFFCDYGEQIHIGKNVFINYNCVFLDSNTIRIDDNTLIGPAVQIYTATHPLKADARITSGGNGTRYLTKSKAVHVKNNCWIGGGVMVMPGVTIGENSTIGAGSVVTKSVPANCFAAGNPCNVIKEL